MTIEALAARLGAAVALACAAWIGVGCGSHESRRGDRVDVSGYPEEIQEAYRVFEVRCSRCHTLARPLNARIDDAQHWIRYVARMRRQPGSGINADNADIILRFLLYYHTRDPDAVEEPAEAEPTAPDTPEAPRAAPEPEPEPARAVEPNAAPPEAPAAPDEPPIPDPRTTPASPAPDSPGDTPQDASHGRTP